jgi:hypothetical protein
MVYLRYELLLYRGALMINTAQVILCNFLFCLPGTHPWDYGYHFLANFGGIILIYILFRKLPLGHIPSRKLALLYSILILSALGIEKEIEDTLFRTNIDTPIDMTANLLGIVLSTILIFVTRIKPIHRL